LDQIVHCRARSRAFMKKTSRERMAARSLLIEYILGLPNVLDRAIAIDLKV
jgi:hypothetical protein